VSKWLIETVNLKKVYRLNDVKIVALEDANFKVRKGEFVSIMGPSGAGKTTLLNLISGLDKPTYGKIFFNGKNIVELSESELTEFRCRNIGFVFQLYNLIPILTALENVELPTIAAGIPRDEGRRRALELLRRVGLESRLHNRPTELSGGEQQRVAIARALVNNPSVIIADEPTGNVDTETGMSLIRLFQELNEEKNVTIIISTHDKLVAEKTQRIIRIRDGKIV